MPEVPAILDVAIGMTLIFLTLSAICSSINEMIANALKLRATFLEKGILDLIGDPTLARQVIEHPLLGSTGTYPAKLPAYIPSQNFALALMDVLRRRAGSASERVGRLKEQIEKVSTSTIRQPLLASLTNADASKALEDLRLSVALIQDEKVRAAISDFLSVQDVTEIRRGILGVSDPRFQRIMLALLDQTETQVQMIEDLKGRIEGWFNDGMDRVSLLYKRYVERILRVLAVAVCLFFNADAIHALSSFWQDPTLRAAIVAQAQNMSNAQNTPAQAGGTSTTGEPLETAIQALQQLNSFPVGWNCSDYNDIVRVGWKSSDVVPAPADASSGQSGLCQAVAGKPIVGGSFSLVNLLLKIVGLGLMSIGVSLGAPFWFTVLQKLVPLRPDKK